eukprot:2126560-Ditylum_brightwellii.AAC.1
MVAVCGRDYASDQGTRHPGRGAAYSLVKSLLRGDTLQVFENEEASQDVKDGPNFTKCLYAVRGHVFPKKAYKTQKKYIRNI